VAKEICSNGIRNSSFYTRVNLLEVWLYLLLAGNSLTEYLKPMEDKDLNNCTDEALMNEAKQLKSFSIINAVLIGSMVGIVVYSLVMNTWGMLTLIPLYLIYRFINDPRNKRSKEVEEMMKERGLK
jgi:hypothetical protein